MYGVESPFDLMWNGDDDDWGQGQSYGNKGMNSFAQSDAWFSRGIGSLTHKNPFTPLSENDEESQGETAGSSPRRSEGDGVQALSAHGTESNREGRHRKLIMGIGHIGEDDAESRKAGGASEPRSDFPGVPKAAPAPRNVEQGSTVMSRTGPGSDHVVVRASDVELDMRTGEDQGVASLIEHFENLGRNTLIKKKSRWSKSLANKFGNAPPSSSATGDWSKAPLSFEIASWPSLRNLPPAPMEAPSAPPTSEHSDSCDCGCKCECGESLTLGKPCGNAMVPWYINEHDNTTCNVCNVDDFFPMCGTCDVEEPTTMDSGFEHDAQPEGADDVAGNKDRSEIVENINESRESTHQIWKPIQNSR